MKPKNEIKVNVKNINSVAKGVAKDLQVKKREANNERKNLTQTINYLCSAETAAGVMFRDFFGLKHGVNKEARKKAAKYITSHFSRALAVYTPECTSNCEGDEVELVFCKYVPCNTKGREITDYLDVVNEIVKIELINRPRRIEIGKQMRELWNSDHAKNETDKIKYAMALKNTFAKHLNKYNIRTCVLGEIIK